ncbi:hypothetical protein B0H16DRAFT_1886361 [Mycena metata]|uniref:Uncharacterized protein n=1 Tax=Mycena metata TaxID=1033252 RepID=A0AAD7J3Y9_9AGAR|nr:hypothetical protein B0H16DRAFT_1886361 [Mycena metata]
MGLNKSRPSRRNTTTRAPRRPYSIEYTTLYDEYIRIFTSKPRVRMSGDQREGERANIPRIEWRPKPQRAMSVRALAPPPRRPQSSARARTHVPLCPPFPLTHLPRRPRPHRSPGTVGSICAYSARCICACGEYARIPARPGTSARIPRRPAPGLLIISVSPSSFPPPRVESICARIIPTPLPPSPPLSPRPHPSPTRILSPPTPLFSLPFLLVPIYPARPTVSHATSRWN